MSIFFHLDLEPPSAPITSPGAGAVDFDFDFEGRRDMALAESESSQQIFRLETNFLKVGGSGFLREY
jgi:hypothetical protein